MHSASCTIDADCGEPGEGGDARDALVCKQGACRWSHRPGEDCLSADDCDQEHGAELACTALGYCWGGAALGDECVHWGGDRAWSSCADAQAWCGAAEDAALPGATSSDADGEDGQGATSGSPPVCLPRLAAGEACSADHQCASRWCWEQRWECTEPRAAGAGDEATDERECSVGTVFNATQSACVTSWASGAATGAPCDVDAPHACSQLAAACACGGSGGHRCAEATGSNHSYGAWDALRAALRDCVGRHGCRGEWCTRAFCEKEERAAVCFDASFELGRALAVAFDESGSCGAQCDAVVSAVGIAAGFNCSWVQPPEAEPAPFIARAAPHATPAAALVATLLSFVSVVYIAP